MVIRAPAQRPMILPVRLGDGKVVDAGDASAHESVLIKFPVLVAVGAKPVAGVVVPLVSKPHCDAGAVKSPKFLDKPIIQFLVPFADEELNDSVTPGEELRAIAPNAVRSVGE